MESIKISIHQSIPKRVEYTQPKDKFTWNKSSAFNVYSYVCLFCFNDLPVMEKLKVYYQESFEDYQKAVEKGYKSSYQGRYGAGVQTI